MEFAKDLVHLQRLGDVLVVTDTSVFDIPWLNRLLDEAGLPPIGYHPLTGEFKDAVNLHSFALGLACKCPGVPAGEDIYQRFNLQPLTPTHFPDEDAWVIAMRMWELCVRVEEAQGAQ